MKIFHHQAIRACDHHRVDQAGKFEPVPARSGPGREGTAAFGERHRGCQRLEFEERGDLLGERELKLTAKEFDLLAALAAEPGVAVTRHLLFERVWESRWFGSTKTIDVHVASLRRKLGNPGWIETVRGVGFRLQAPQ